MTLDQALSNIRNWHTATTTTNPMYPVGGGVIDTRYPTPRSFVTTEMLDHDAFKIPLSTLMDMWLARFGNDWVDMTTLADDQFFAIAAERLRSTGKLESHYLTDRARFVCRKAE